ncbi:MAG: cation diffusion facilitator family transporter, partial [Acetobacteraceae bacterium]
MSHSHDHGAGHAHGHHGHGETGHATAALGRAFAIGAAVNLAFVLGEVGFGVAANSMALLADAAHNFGDVLGLLLAWWAQTLAGRMPTPRRTYGFRRFSILAALINASVLLIGVGVIAAEAVRRLLAPQPVGEITVMAVAAAGILVNGGSALLFFGARAHDLNVRAAFTHLAADAV